MKYRQWVVDAIPYRRPHAERCTTETLSAPPAPSQLTCHPDRSIAIGFINRNAEWRDLLCLFNPFTKADSNALLRPLPPDRPSLVERKYMSATAILQCAIPEMQLARRSESAKRRQG